MNEKKRKLILTVVSLLVIVLSVLIIFGIIYLNQPEYGEVWGEEKNDYGHDIAINSEDNVYIVGDTANFGEGDEDVVLIKLNEKGGEDWKRTWGGKALDNGWGMTVDSEDNLYLTGRTISFGKGCNDVILLKYSKSGDLLLNKTWGRNMEDIGYDIVVDSNQNIYIVGYKSDFVSYNTIYDMLIIKFDSSGNELWNVTFGKSSKDDGARAIALDSQDNLYVTGYTYSHSKSMYANLILLKYDSSGTLLWNKTHGVSNKNEIGSDIIIGSNDNVFITGYRGSQAVLLKYNNNGDLIWESVKDGRFYGIALGSDGMIYTCGIIKENGNNDIKVSTFDSNGKNGWHNIWGDSAIETGKKIALDSQDNLYIIGHKQYTDESYDMVIVKNLPPMMNLVLVLMVLIPIDIVVLIGLAYYGIIKPRTEKRTKERVYQQGSLSISKKLISSISEEETIIYQSNLLKNEKIEKYWNVISSIVTISLALFFLTLTLQIFDYPNWEEIFDSLPFAIGITVAVVIVFPLIFKLIKRSFRQDVSFIITDKNLHLSLYKYEDQIEWIEKISLENIHSVVFKKRLWDQDEEHGTVDIIKNDKNLPIYTVKNIPDFLNFQNLFESILYHFGDQDKDKYIDGLYRPNFTISPENYEKISKRKLKLTGLLLISPLIGSGISFGIASFMFIILGSLEDFNLLDIFFSEIFLIYAILFNLICFFAILFEKLKMKHRMIGPHSELHIKSSKFLLKSPENVQELSFGKFTCLEQLKILKSGESITEMDDEIDGIRIRKSFNSDERIIFGPLENFIDNFQSIFWYLLEWKANNNLLFSKKRLLRKRQDILAENIKSDDNIQELAFLKGKKKKDFNLTPLPISQNHYSRFRNYFEPNENIVLTYQPKVNLIKKILPLLIGVGGFIALFLLSASAEFSVDFFIISLIGTIVFLFICLIGCMSLPTVKLFKNSEFVFTDEKVIAQYSDEILITPYQNILNISTYHRFFRNSEKILIHLKHPIETSPFMDKYTIIIPEVSTSSDLREKIEFLKEKFGESKSISKS